MHTWAGKILKLLPKILKDFLQFLLSVSNSFSKLFEKDALKFDIIYFSDKVQIHSQNKSNLVKTFIFQFCSKELMTRNLESYRLNENTL